jgi:hypothetical protein
MAKKKTSSSTKKNPAKISTEKNFVLRFHTSLDGENNSRGSPMFYSESGQGWVADIGSATRYSESGADGRILELLKEHKIASELVDLNVKPDNLFSLNTAFLDDDNVPQIITKVPQFPGDTYYHLIPSNENIKEQDLVDVLKEDRFTVLWDPVGSFVPEDNESWLNGLMGKS